MFSHIDRILACDGWTNGQTDTDIAHMMPSRSRFSELLYRTVYQCVGMSTTSLHLVHKAFKPCEYFGHTAWRHMIFNAIVIAKLTYAASSWWGFAMAKDRQWLETVICRCICSGLCAPDYMSLEDSVTDADDKLLNLILYSKHHVLHSILPDHSDFNYNLRPRHCNLVLTAKSSSITDRDYVSRMIFKNIY